MTPEHRRQLADLIENHKEAIIEDWLARIRPLLAAENLSNPELVDDVPDFLDELVERIRDIDRPHSWSEGIHTEEQMEHTAKTHGQQRFHVGFDIVEVVKEYGILREVVSDLAERENVHLTGKGGQVVHFAFNQGLAAAAYAFQKEKENEMRQRRRQYLSFVMHDLKTPLNAIVVAAQVIEDQVDDAKLVAEMNGIILRSAEKLDEELQKTIQIAKTNIADETNQLMPRNFELWPVVQSVIEEFRVLASVDKTSIHNLVPSTMTIYADALAMKSVFRNLLSNALKYAPGGKVVIGVSTSRKDQVDIWVRDNGKGIPKPRIDQLFQKVSPDPEHK